MSCDESLDKNPIDNTSPESVVLFESTYVTKSSIELVWTRNEDDDFQYYLIYRDSVVNVNDSSILVCTIYNRNSTRYIDLNLEVDTKYYYRIFIFDKSGNFSMSNVIYAITEIKDYCLEFDGENDYIEVLDDSTLDISGNVTLEAWIKSYDKPNGYLFWKYIYYYTWNGNYYEGNGHGYTLYINSSMGFTFDIYDGYGGRGLLNSAPLQINDWIHIAAVYDSDSIKIYTNGILNEVKAYSSGIDTNSINLRFGNSYNEYGNHYHFSGAIDGIRISTSARYYENFIPKYPSEWNIDEHTVGLWRFDEDIGNILYDYSGNENHGTIYGAKWVLH